MRRFIFETLQSTFLVGLVASQSSRLAALVPKSLIPLPTVVMSAADERMVTVFFAVATASTFALRGLLWRPPEMSLATRISWNWLTLVVALVAAVEGLFFTVPINFDPRTMVAVCGTALMLSVIVDLARTRLHRQSVKWIFTEVGRRAVAWPGIAVLAFALTLPATAWLFVRNRDFANEVTQIRFFFYRLAAPGESAFGFVDAFGTEPFAQPMFVQSIPGSRDVFVVLERRGRIYRVTGASRELLLDFSSEVGDVEVENGALGLAVHPQFSREGAPGHGLVFVFYTNWRDGAQENRLASFDLDADSPTARLATERRLIVQGRGPDGFHNGGGLVFGPDGFLYLAVGEASSYRDHQRLDGALFGGVLRIDVDNRGGDVSRPIARQPVDGTTSGYAIPWDNPLADQPDQLGEFWAWGLRNPFRISFDPTSGNLWAGDVGSTVWEEVNRIERGANYQFPFVEGPEPTSEQRPARPMGREEGPVFTYRHTGSDRAVIGGIVYRGRAFGELAGHYVFADNYSGQVMAFPVGSRTVDRVDVLAQVPQLAQRGVSSIAQGPNGEIFVTVLGRATAPTGSVLRLVRAGDASSAGVSAAVPLAVTPEESRSTFLTNCSRCHGETGDGRGPDSAAIAVPLPDFTSPTFHTARTEADLAAVILHGGTARGRSPAMPPWSHLLNEAEVDALVAYMRTLVRP